MAMVLNPLIDLTYEPSCNQISKEIKKVLGEIITKVIHRSKIMAPKIQRQVADNLSDVTTGIVQTNSQNFLKRKYSDPLEIETDDDETESDSDFEEDDILEAYSEQRIQ